MEISIDNPGKKRIFCENNGVVTEFFSPSFKIPLKNGYLKLKQTTPVKIFLTDQQGKKVHSWEFAVHFPADKDLKLSRFYAGQSESVSYTHTFHEKSAVLKIFDQNHRLIKQYSPVPQQGILSLTGIAPQPLTVELADGENRISRLLVLTEEDFAPLPLPDGRKLTVDGKFFTYNDEPIFLIGTNNTPRKHLHREEAFNLNCGTFGFQKNAVTLQILPGKRLIRKPTVGFLYADDWKKQIFDAVGNSDSGTFSRICYEAQLDVYLPDNGGMKKVDQAKFYHELYRDLKKRYPDKLFSIHCDQSVRLPDFIDSCDIIEGAFWSSSYSGNMMINLRHDLRHMAKLAQGKPAIFWLGGSIPDAQCRTAEELRAGVFAAIFHDMAGVMIHLGHGGLPPERERLWSLISGINADVQQWYPAFRKGKKLPDFIRNAGENFYCTAWEYENKTYIGVINLSGGENQLDVNTAKGNISHLFTPFEPKIFILP